MRIAESVDAMLDGAESREAWKTSDSLSGSRFERVRINGIAHIVKYTSVDDDWIMRASGDLESRQLTLLQSGVLDRLPSSIDHTMVAAAPFVSRSGRRGLALLMRDVSALMVPPGSAPIDLELHRSFLAHMAELHAAYWGFSDTVGLFPFAHSFVILTPAMAAIETATARADPVPPAVGDGWRALDERYPAEAARLRELATDPWPLVTALRAGPQTLIQGDWKLGNLGGTPSRTVLIDWDRTGEGSPLFEIAWYVAVNCDRLPESKEATIAAYRAALESEGVVTTPWFDTQLDAALVGAFLMLGWSKTGDRDEFAWWATRLHRWWDR